MASRLPQEVLIDILARLTVEDLVRCITVSKSWYSLITSPNFISFHINQISSKSTNNRLLLIREHENYWSNETHRETYCLHFDNDDSFKLYKKLDFPFRSRWNAHFRVVGCVNGVVCLSDDETSYLDVIILWNPTIKKSVTLPKPPITCKSHGPYGHALGFGINTVTNDYKVVRAVNIQGYETRPSCFEVYDLSVGSWRTIDSKGFNYGVMEHGSQAFLNGSVHWVGYNIPESNKEFFHVIVSFNLDSEVLGVMKLSDMMPTLLDWPQGPRSRLLSVFRGSLSLNVFEEKANRCCLWVMKQYGLTDSWTQLFTIDLSSRLDEVSDYFSRRPDEVCGYRNNGEALLSVRTRGGSSMVSYDSNSKQRKYLKEFQSQNRSFNVENFVESLSLLGVKGEQVMKAADNSCSQQKVEEEGKEEQKKKNKRAD